MLDYDFNPTWDKSNSKRFEESEVYGKIGLGWFFWGFGCGVFSSLEKVAFLLRESTLLLTFFSVLTHYMPLWMQESYSYQPFFLPSVSVYVYFKIYWGKVLKS